MTDFSRIYLLRRVQSSRFSHHVQSSSIHRQMPQPPEIIVSQYAGFIDITKGNVVYIESPLPLDPSLPQLQKPSWLDDFRRQVGPPIQASPNSHRYPAPSDQDPLTIFTPMINACSVPAPRWVHVDSAGLGTVLLFTDGAAINNGQPNAKAGCGIVFVPARLCPKGVAFCLEADNDLSTSNRAELLAVLSCYICGWEKALPKSRSPQIRTTLSVGYVNMCSLGRVGIGPRGDVLQ